MDVDPDFDKKDVRRPMNAFLIFCKRHRSIVRERNSHLDNRSVTRILGDLWANIGEEEKNQYIELAKQYKDAFMKANPDYKWHNPERMPQLRPTNERIPSSSTGISEDGPIVPGKLADPSNMGGLSMLMPEVKSNQYTGFREPDQGIKPVTSPLISASSFCPWISQQDIEEEKKLIIDESDVKQECKTSVASNFSTLKQELSKKEPPLQKTYSNPDQNEKNPADPDDAIYSYGKVVMDHIIDKLYLSTLKNMGQENKNVINASPNKNPPQPATKEVLKPPSHGKKSYHTSIAVKNLLEFTRRAAAREETNLKNLGLAKSTKPETDDKCVSETKQKLKDFCLKKEGRPKVVSGTDNSDTDVKEFKRKRCYSESCAEIYRNQEKRMKLQSEQCEDTRKLFGNAIDDDNQPTRKSRRRNRGQRYQELINEGIIQPSKARLAAMKTDTGVKNISFKEMFFSKRPEELGDEVLSVYPRQIRKRTMSESEKNRTAFEESNRYRTGDFDLEAHIKTLPACSIEKVVRPKRTVGKSSLSESDSSVVETSEQPEMKLSAHLKTKPSNNNVPVVGSRKRKARKHSITHLLPVKDVTNPEVAATTLSGIIQMESHQHGLIGLKQTKDTDKNSESSSQSVAQCDDASVKECETSGAKNKMDVNSEKTEASSSIVKKEYSEEIENSDIRNIDGEQIKVEHSDTNDIECQEISIKNEYSDTNNTERGENSAKFENSDTCYVETEETCVKTEYSDSNKPESGEISTKIELSDASKVDSKEISETMAHSDSGNADHNLCNQKFTKLKDSLTPLSSDLKPSDESCDSVEAFTQKSDLLNYDDSYHFKDQDENSNDPICCHHSNRNLSSDICEKGSHLNSEGVTMVTAVSVSVPVTTSDICVNDTLQESETENIHVSLDSKISQCDITSSSVTMTTIQPSLTCLF